MKRRRQIVLALVFSLLLHLLLLLLGASLSLFDPYMAKKEEPEAIDLQILKSGRQIADISPPEKEERPEESKFLGLYDSKVKEEQVAPSTIGASGGAKPRRAPEKVVKKEEKNEESFKVAAKEPDRFHSEAFKDSEGEAEKEGEEDLFNGLSEDFFPNYKIGDRTYLNVLKYPKISYFVRLKKIFRTTWNPVSALRQSGFVGRISKGSIDVVLGVTIDRKGRLSDLLVIRSSGLRAYDQEALRTIRASAPFATPPQELLDNYSLLRMAWTFTIYL